MSFLDSLADALPHSIFANLRNSHLARGLADAAQEAIFGRPTEQPISVTPRVGTLPGENVGVGSMLNPQRQAMYQQGGFSGGLLDAVPDAQRPFIEGLARTVGPDAAAKQATDWNAPPAPMSAYQTATLARETANDQFNQRKPIFADPNSTGYTPDANGGYQPTIQGQPKPPQTRTITRGTDTVTQQFNDKTGQFEDVASGPRQLPSQPTSAMSPERIAQEKDLISARSQAQMSDEATMDTQAQAIANYQQAPLTSFAMSKPQGQALMARVMQINPKYRSQNYKMSNDAQTRFASGPQGNVIRSFNVGISHLNTLDKLASALGNGDVQALNSLRNSFQEQFGSEAPTNFDAAKAIVGDEIIKAIVGGGGALADRENAQNQISRAKTPAQLKGVIKTYKDLMAGQLKGLKQQYSTSTFLDNFNEKLSPETIAELEQAAPAGGATASAAPPPVPQRGAVVDGYRFLGGDPKLPRNWQKVQ